MERLTTSKLIRDLSGRPREPFFGPEWQERNKQDILLAREQTRQARNHQLQVELNEANETAGDDIEAEESRYGS